MILFVDPGEKGGFADFSSTGELRETGKLSWDKSKKLGILCFKSFRIPRDTTRIFVEKQQPMGSIVNRGFKGGASKVDYKIGFLYGLLLQALYEEALTFKTPPVIIEVPIATWKAALKKETRQYPVLPSDTKELAEMYARKTLGDSVFEKFTILSKRQVKPHDGIADALTIGLLYFQGYLDM